MTQDLLMRIREIAYGGGTSQGKVAILHEESKQDEIPIPRGPREQLKMIYNSRKNTQPS